MVDSSPLDGSLVEAAELIRSRAVSSAELTAASIARAKDTHAQLNAFLRIDEDAAMQSAYEADREIAAGNYRGPLHGIPLAHKDMFYREGEITSCGSEIRRNFRGQYTSKLIQRLGDAGSVTVGWLNLSEFAGGPTGHNKHFGDCCNPWDLRRITGGSSSGSGAAVAARIVFGALGSDTGGSVRIPASCCGVVGVKATYGLVSRHGAMPRSWSLDHVGPLARTVEDAAVLTRVIAGSNEQDPTAFRDFASVSR
jgi:aspartyl-tRNA(Asn)/glutamyl-tRNA(Gln) amidotransferase subunit A